MITLTQLQWGPLTGKRQATTLLVLVYEDFKPQTIVLQCYLGINILVINDWALAPLSKPERRDFWVICEDRYQVRSTILTSQLPVARWHEPIGDPTLAYGILDRLVHNADRIEIRADSMRKNRPKPSV